MKKASLRTSGLLISTLMFFIIASVSNVNAQACKAKTMACQQQVDSGKPACKMGMANLTPEQEQKMTELRTKKMKETLPIKNEINEKQAHLNTLMSVEKPDMNAINAVIDEISILKGKIMKINATHKQEIRKLLTEEQRVSFDTKCCMSNCKSKCCDNGCCMGNCKCKCCDNNEMKGCCAKMKMER